jgi:hypothetical protein
MPSSTRTALLSLAVALPLAAAATFPNAPAQGGQFLLSPAVLMAEAETTEQDGMMGQGGMGGMGGMMDQGEMGQGGMGGMGSMMNMMQQMSRMMESCDEMMQSMMDEGSDQRPGGGDTETQQQ